MDIREDYKKMKELIEACSYFDIYMLIEKAKEDQEK